jgi:hypothetical protein
MKQLFLLLLLIGITFPGFNQSVEIKKNGTRYKVNIKNGNANLVSPDEGLWSVATAWQNDWPAEWHHSSPDSLVETGGWKILTGYINLGNGKLLLRDAYRTENGMIKCVRRFEWTGEQTLDSVTLAVRWNAPGRNMQAFLPGIVYYGNPSGEKSNPERVPWYHGTAGEMAIFEEHRYSMPFACLESSASYGAAIHSLPSRLKDKKNPDHWWSMGVMAFEGYSELVLLSGPLAYNNQKSVAKALASKPMKYSDTFISLAPGTVIEKTFYIDLNPITKEGTAFQKPVHNSIALFKPFFADDLPGYEEIIQSKHLFAKSRWTVGDGYIGFNKYPTDVATKIVMGWAGQCEAPGYAFQVLKNHFKDPDLMKMVQQSLDFLCSSPVGKDGFPVQFEMKTKTWSAPDNVSMGQAMYNIGKAIQTGRKNRDVSTTKWEDFLKSACNFAAERILAEGWYPKSTAEAFYIAPLGLASELFKSDIYRRAAIKAADHFAERHLSMKEPYWGGTLDASCEDKEGAWAGFQGFLAAYDLTGEKKYLEYAKHACDVCLSYTVVWDIPLPPGRLADHFFKSRGWTVVSPQNQHIDVFGVLYTPEIYRMGQLLNDENLKKLAIVMFRSCGQITDPFGSQGEQMQQTNYAQRGDMSDVYNLRGGYAERWTVFWITAHFLNAAARFEEMGVVL